MINLYHASMLDWLAAYEGEPFDACVTDPPYELGFMGKGWDSSGIAFQAETWRRVFDALKPGAYLVAFSGTRTYHRMACAIEDAGFEIRDQLAWAYGSGFPKSHDVSKAIDKAAGAEQSNGPLFDL
jgi:site-specific DNA-methyltransferase (adenine-specific)